MGMGVVIAKLPSGEWSPPTSIGIGGLGGGFMAGAEMVDFLIVLNSRAAVKSFMTAGSLQLGGNMSLAVGPLGRTGEASAAMNSEMQLAAMFSYSISRGLYGGVSIEGTVLIERKETNEGVYGPNVTPMQILSGNVDVPQFAVPLIMRIEEVTGSVPFQDEESSILADEERDGELRPWSKPSRPQRPRVSYVTHDMPRSQLDDLDQQLQSASLQGKEESPPSERPYRRPESFGLVDSSSRRPSTQRQSTYKIESVGRGSKRTSTTDTVASENPFSDANTVRDDDDDDRVFVKSREYTNLPYQPRQQRRPIMQDNEFDSLIDTKEPQHLENQASRPKAADLIDPSILDGDLVVALHDFQAQRDSDLSFKRGDLIRVTRRTEKENDWWSGELVANYRDGPPESGEYV